MRVGVCESQSLNLVALEFFNVMSRKLQSVVAI